MIADVISNKKFHPSLTDCIIRVCKLNISLVLITQSYFPVPNDVMLSVTHFYREHFRKTRDLRNCY